MSEQRLDEATFEVVRKRLDEQAGALARLSTALNERRRSLFGGVGLALSATARVRTEHAAIPRDIVAVGGRLILGYHAVLGLKRQTTVEDVFLEFEERDGGIEPVPRSLLTGAAFEKDLGDIFQYFKDARLLYMGRTESLMLAVFQTGARPTDVRVLRWALERGPGGERLRYVDNQGERDYRYPPPQDFTWTRTTREMHVQGTHAHINILDTVFVECLGGDLTLKIENNTETGAGVFSEPVDDPTQGLDDAEFHYADLQSCILIKVRPYREQAWRHLVYNKLTREAVRIDAIGLSCQQLPEGHGLVFPGGYYLADGTHKVFPVDPAGMVFKRAVRAPNGEDVAYIFYRRDLGTYLILHYNLIAREVSTPLHCNCYCRFPDGRWMLLKCEPEAGRVHQVQVWTTPFCDDDLHAAAAAAQTSFLGKVGNRDLVRAVSDLLSVGRLVAAQTPSREAYEELLRQLRRILDAYPWLGHEEAGDIRAQLNALLATAERVIDEFEKAQGLMQQAAAKVAAAEGQAEALLRKLRLGGRTTLEAHVQPLAEIRAQRGGVEGLRQLRFTERARLDALDARLVQAAEGLAQEAVAFLMGAEALAPWAGEINELEAKGGAATAVAEAKPILERLGALAAQLDVLVDTVGQLPIADDRDRTAILDRVGAVYGALGKARAVADQRRRQLGSAEGRAAFGAALKLLAQAQANALALCDAAERCDEQLARLSLQVEELEGRFADLDEAAPELATRRAELAEAFAARRQALLDERARRADGLARAAGRLIETIARRSLAFDKAEDFNAFFAADPMVGKARGLVEQLRQLGEAVRGDEIEGRLKAAREDGLRRLRDRSELFDGDAVKIGRHRFSANRQAMDLVIVPRPGADGATRLFAQLSGTGFATPLDDPGLDKHRGLWDLESEAESPGVYRGEWLAWTILDAASRGEGVDEAALREAGLKAGGLEELAREAMQRQGEAGYERGVHDHDAARILAALLDLRAGCGPLRHPAAARALAVLAWARLGSDGGDASWWSQCRSLYELRALHPQSPALRSALDQLLAEIASLCRAEARRFKDPQGDALAPLAAAYFFEELGSPGETRFAFSGEAAELERRFAEFLALGGADSRLAGDLHALRGDPAGTRRLLSAWLSAFADAKRPDLAAAVPEVVAARLEPQVPRVDVSARTAVTLEGLLGRHPRIRDGRLELRIDEAVLRLSRHANEHLPAWRDYQRLRRAAAQAQRERLRVDELKPKVLTSFVRNRLIDEVYLPLIGDNLAKQMGALGASRRTDQMGLLLLISPPGYGKTTLLEYVASVLGFAFVKVNGPAMGHRTVSLDPAEAPNAGARQEVERINLALAMGDNALLLIDDIQHCSPELLQKFIPLCDGTRRIEGVWEGRARTFDLRGRRFVVAMAGNPYTETGDRFRIPDMLANRADTFNLGDIVGGHREAFELSYLENCLSSNPILQPLAARPRADLHRLIRLAGGDEGARAELEHPYSALELQDITAVFAHLRRVQACLLTVNLAYISSAATAEEFRSEPPFKLQGSYRNMAKIADKVVPAMSAAEVDALVQEHYRAEAQTLTSGAEASTLKLRQMLGWQSPADAARWKEICAIYTRRQELAGADDPASKAVVQLAKLAEQVGGLRDAMAASGAAREAAEAARAAGMADSLAKSLAALAPPKVEVVNTLPRYYGKLYEQHIQVLETGLAPVLDLLSRQSGAAAQARENLKGIADDLRRMMNDQVRSPRRDVADDKVGSGDA